MASPVTEQVVAGTVAVHDLPSGFDVATYDAMGAPPSEVGGSQDTAAVVSPGTADTSEGESGAVTGGDGTTAVDGVDAGEVRFCWLVARTVKM